MNKPQFPKPTNIAGIGNRYELGSSKGSHPGPYALGGKTDLLKIFPQLDEITVIPPDAKHIKGDCDETVLVIQIAKWLNPRIVVEVGTFRGRTTYALAKNLPNARVVTIDYPLEERKGQENIDGHYSSDELYFLEKERIGELFRGTGSHITQILSDCTRAPCQAILDQVLGVELIDFAFIDAAHSFDVMRASFEDLILPRLSSGGIVIFDDYNRPVTHVGVMHYLMDAAYRKGFLFYANLPVGTGEESHLAFFQNLPHWRNRNWRDGA